MGESLNEKLIGLVGTWQSTGSPEQEGFDWTASRDNWLKAFPAEAKFIQGLRAEVDRQTVRDVCKSQKYGIREKFLAAMIWGYGNRGYGPYRVTQMLNQSNSEEILINVYELCKSGEPKEAYQFLKSNRIRILGPSYGSKFINFCTPREIGAPIYDSLISTWIDSYAKEEFAGLSTRSESWNSKTYNRYWDWVKIHSDSLNCFADQIELVLFRDAELRFAKSSSWSGK
jgi:hypothetical protein